MVGAAADYARAEPAKLAALRHRVRLAFDTPVAIGSAEERKGLMRIGRINTAIKPAAVIVIVRPFMFFVVFGRVEHRASFDESDIDAELRQNLHHRATACARTNDHNVVNRRGLHTDLSLSHPFNEREFYDRISETTRAFSTPVSF